MKTVHVIIGRPTSKDWYERYHGHVSRETIATITDNKDLAERTFVAAAASGAWIDITMTEGTIEDER